MKLWYQSSMPLEGLPILNKYRKMIYEHSNNILSNNHIDVYGVKTIIQEIEYKYVEYLNKREIIENMIKAEKRDYDAIVLGCFLDPGLQEARGVVDIPIASLGESSLLFACILGKKYSIITYNEKLVDLYKRNIISYGLQSRVSEIGVMEGGLDIFEEAFNNPTSIIESFIEASKKMVDRGAEVIIPGCGLLNLLLVKNNIYTIEEKGVPILDCVGLTLLMAKDMVTLKKVSGVTISRRSYYALPSKEVLRKINKLYPFP